ncbi:MAG: TerC family protein [Flavobacteriales bacterium]|jgi:predicted tellurium resistance membrane protein TerC|nr:TerC family protein [Flavobacteriales bacterium]MBK7752213.1 TerC family protein [Flavobacteriales bacterium]MBK9074303.1 TerC family protein [Flavobacteriales bacterium]
MELLDILIALLTLITLEVVLGIDNVIFISILADRLPEEQRDRLRRLGLALAMVIRLGLLALVAWIMKLDTDLFTLVGRGFSGKDIILFLGGGFLLVKATREIYHMTEQAKQGAPAASFRTFGAALVQVLVLDVVFSVDSIITAVGMVDELWMMYVAVVVTVVIMLIASKPIATFITDHPSFKVLALAFLMVIGVALVAEGMGQHLPKGYIYGPMAFAFFVDVLQMRVLRGDPKDKTGGRAARQRSSGTGP